MSYSALLKIDPSGDVVPYQKFPNSFRGAFRIWADFAVRYGLATEENCYGLLASVESAQKIWDLIKAPGLLPRHEQIVMLATFDKRLCRREDFPELVAALRQYHAELKDDTCHAALWADAIASLPADCLGCGWQHSSASDDLWGVIDQPETDEFDAEYRRYNVNVDTDDHAWIFDELRDS